MSRSFSMEPATRNSQLETRNRPPAGGRGSRAAGFTLVEAVMVIVITGLIAAAVAVFINKPVQGYFDAVHRAELTDAADTALRRIGRDLRLALPNSVRVASSGGNTYLEFLLTSGGGRYRAETDSGGGGNILDFTAADGSFDVLGPAPPLAAGDSIVVFNLGPGFAGADAYAGGANNRAAYSSGGSTITLAAAKLFPFESPGKRFQVVPYAVTYECAPNPGNPAAGVVRRYWNYGINAAQATPPAGGSNALLVTQVSGCALTYDANAVAQRNGVVLISLTLDKGGEQVTLMQQVHVSNIP